MSTLPLELFDCIAEFVEDQQTLLALTRSLPYAPISVHRLFHSIQITHPDTVPKLYRRIRSGLNGLDALGNSNANTTFDASGLVHHLTVESWTVDADVLINLLRLLPNLWTLSLWIGPSNFSPEHLEEMFKPPIPSLEYLSLRFRPYVKKATYYQFLKGSYFDSTLLALSSWPPSPAGLPTLSIVQDTFTPDLNDPTPRFAQPIVFFRLDLHLSLLVHSPASQKSLKTLRVRIPARPIIQPLTVAYLHPTTPNPDVSPSPPSLELLDIATCAVSEADVEKLLLRFTSLRHLVLDACTMLLRGGSPQASGAELDWWSALGRRLALAGVKRAKEREKELKEWYEARQRSYMTPEFLEEGGEEQRREEPKRMRRGRKGLATATITLRGAATSPPRAGAMRRASPPRATASQAQAGPSPPGTHEAEERENSSNELSASENEEQSDKEHHRDENIKVSLTGTTTRAEKRPQNKGKRRAVPSVPAPVPSTRQKPPPIPKIHVIPPLPILNSLALFPSPIPNTSTPSRGINPDVQVQIRAEFERGWNDGLRVIWEIRARMGASFVRSHEERNLKSKGKGKEDAPKPKFFAFKENTRRAEHGWDSEEEEYVKEKAGHEGLQDVFPGMEDIFFRSDTTPLDTGGPPTLCLTGSDPAATGHAVGCGHFVGSEKGLERL